MHTPNLGLLATAAAVAALASAPATSAGAGPVGGCPQGFDLIPLAHAPSLASVDRNGDAYLCSKPLPNVPSQPAFQDIDNNVLPGAPIA
jgi:hypothetical protein